MASSSTEICNLALRHVGVSKEIANIDSEKSAEASACRRFYASTLDEVLREFPWPFSTTFATLALVSSSPNQEWGYAYRVPADCLTVRRILSGIRNEYRAARVPFKLGQDGSGGLIFTDATNAQLEYTARVTNVSQFPPDFVLALSLKIGAYIAPSITGGDPFKLRASTLQLYEAAIGEAMEGAANEEQQDDTPDGEFIRERN